ncbi:hypothetical protein J2Z83_003751 [Virgibacillus natechei]|uniref:DUF3954 domain-containing protein n=1 Tax=Virgibacillus natechei TaxID=1216297 RepID=A0ABS4IM06_9BACI|nr:DUF3954 domain-containing protein [Virgibacillus natechei]MBP1971600.1 hypothetical protein [Virgibacillus natechei]UZD13069.1 DUF3954 domain-containing protein [Virgibacillus natechei]
MNKVEVRLDEDAVYIIQDGKKIKVSPKQFGNDKIIWMDGKVLDIERSERVRVEGQEII